jgi:hypothetical protein
MGAGVDDRKPGRSLPLPARIDSITLGSEVSILKKDGTLLKGMFVSKGLVDTVEYRTNGYSQKFEQWRVGAGMNLHQSFTLAWLSQVEYRLKH